MSLLNWKPEYSVGVESVDFEHRQMIELINSIYAEIQGRNDADSIEQFLGDVHAAIAAHFALEERAMQQSGYAEYLDHKDNHEELLDQIRDLMDEFVADPAAGSALLEQRLSDWFGVHFSTHDARLHGSLNH